MTDKAILPEFSISKFQIQGASYLSEPLKTRIFIERQEANKIKLLFYRPVSIRSFRNVLLLQNI